MVMPSPASSATDGAGMAPPARRWSSRVWLPVAAILGLGAAVRALGFVGPRFWSASGDDVRLAVQALGILQGTLPVDYLGVEYAGATPAYPLAVWFALAGSSTLALDLFAYGVGLAILWTGYRLARRLLSGPDLLLALVVLAIPPLILWKWSLAGSLDYPFLLLLGNVVLLLTHALFFRGPGRAGTVLVLGLVSGLALWTHGLSLVYVAPAIVLGVRTGLAFRPRAWLFPIGALAGGLPALVYELQHFPSTRFTIHEAGGMTPLTFGARARIVFGSSLPGLLGVDRIDLRPSITSLAAVVLLALGVVAVARAVVRDRADLAWLVGPVARAVVRDRADLAWLVGLGAERGGGSALLWLVAMSLLSLLLFTQRGVHGAQYLLPLYAILPCWIGEALYWLWGRRRALGVLALSAFVWVQCLAIGTVLMRASPDERARWAPLQQKVAPLRDWLDARGIDRVYWEALSPTSFQLSYLVGMRIVAADLWSERVSPHSHLVDAAPDPPILVDPPRAEALRDSLRALGMDPGAATVSSFAVFRPKATVPMGFAPIPPEGWTVTASEHPEIAGLLVDRDATTGWSTRAPQVPGQWLAVDLGTTRNVARIDLLALDWTEVPAGFRVETSRDGTTWSTVASAPRYWGPLFFSERHAFLKVQRGRLQAIFPPVPARFIRILQTGQSPHEWAARELFVYRPAPPSPEVAGSEILAALRREGVTVVHTNPWLSAVVRTESGWRIATTEWNELVNSYGRLGAPSGFTVFRAGAGHAILAGSDADLPEIHEMLASRWASVRESGVGPYRLLVLPDPDAPRRPMSSKGWTATASENDAASRLAIDGHSRTRWVSRSPAGPGLSFGVDLGAVRRVRAVRLRPASADLRLEGSRDGAEWVPIGPVRWAGPLFWTGWELLRADERGWAVSFSPVDLRYLRLTPRQAAANPWAIEELRIFD
jgi:hypothetical protein